MSELKVFTARAIRTMTIACPVATAVAVRDGMIVEVGSLESLAPWLSVHPHEIDERFRDAVLMPGFIDPHLHPSMAAVILPMHFVTAMPWRLPWQSVDAVQGRENYLRRLHEIEAGLESPDEPMFSWGYHQIWHGEIDRAALNALSATRPIVVWHRSFHELFVNDAAIRWMKFSESDLEDHAQVDAGKGRFYETGQNLALTRLNPYLLAEERFAGGLERLHEVVRLGGHTTIGDMSVGSFDLDREYEAYTRAFENEHTPFRVQMIPDVSNLHTGDDDESVAIVRRLVERNSPHLEFRNHVKLYTDGAFFSELMQLNPPGFIDGHHGEWLTAPERFTALARLYWNAGFAIHVHCTGDLGVELALDVLEALQWERPRFRHGFTIEHFGLSNPEQIKKIAELGARVSANPYYVYELSDAYYRNSIGHERAIQMTPLGSLRRENVTLALHTDFTMAPALPLNTAWVAVNRLSESGQVMGAHERLTIDEAMRAITIDAAYVLGMENEIGSIRAGKRADFTVLAEDPYDTEPELLKDIPVLGTIFEGTVFEQDS